MKKYLMTDITAVLLCIAATLIGGYFFLQSEVIEQKKQKESLQQKEKRVELKTFEHLSKRTE